MFKGEKGTSGRIKKAVKYFSDYDQHLIHSRPLSTRELMKFDLKIDIADNKLADLLWETYILLNGFFNVSPFVKLYENRHGVSWGKQFQQVFIEPQPQQKVKNPH